MQHTAMLKPKYSTILAIAGIEEAEDGDEALRDQKQEAQREEKQAKIALLNHLLLERYGMDMGGRLGINSSRGRLAQVYLKQAQGKTDEEKAKSAVKQVDEIVKAFNKVLDSIRFPKQGVSSPAR